MLFEIVKKSHARPLSNRRNQRDVVIEYLIARSNDEIFVHITGKRRLNGDEFEGGEFSKKYYSLSSLAAAIRQIPSPLRRPASSIILKDFLPPNNNVSGAIVAILRAEDVLLCSSPTPENYAYAPFQSVSGYLNWRNPSYSIDDFLEEMIEMDTLDTVEVAESKIWRRSHTNH